MDDSTVKASIFFAFLVFASSLPTKHDTVVEGSSQQGRGGFNPSSSENGDGLWATRGMRKRSAVQPSLDMLWPGGKVPYVFAELVARRSILAAMDHISNLTCIEFVPRTVETVYVKFTHHPQNCNTLHGRVPYLFFLPTYEGQQVLLTPACANNTGTILNLLGSTLGLWAEHLRPDRDSYVTVLWDIIIPSQQNNFKIKPNIDTSYGPYDLGSIMHYPLDADSKNGSNTMELKVAYEGVVGQRVGLSSLDVLKIRQMYGCPVETAMSSPSSIVTSTPTITFTSGSGSSPTISSTLGVSPSQEVTMETTTVLVGESSTAENSSSGPGPERDAIRFGSEIALKLLTKEGDAHLWLGCTGTACMASECPGPTFSPKQAVLCQECIYLIMLASAESRAYGDDLLRTGDQVVLMHLGGITLYCNETTFSCMMLPDCRDKSGKFSSELCSNTVLVVRAPVRGAGSGQVIRDGDDIMLDYVINSVPFEGWKDTLYCHPEDNGHCERRYCTDVSLLDQYTPDGRYNNGCRLIYTVYKLPS